MPRPLMALADEAEVNVIRGKNLVGKATKDDVDVLLAHITAIEHVLDEEADPEDAFGTEGWRHHFKCALR